MEHVKGQHQGSTGYTGGAGFQDGLGYHADASWGDASNESGQGRFDALGTDVVMEDQGATSQHPSPNLSHAEQALRKSTSKIGADLQAHLKRALKGDVNDPMQPLS
jgi:hypothetical protein